MRDAIDSFYRRYSQQRPNSKYGIFLVPIYRYGNAGSTPALFGKVCTLMGRERSGTNAGKYNLFGGTCEGGSLFDNLLRETQEEMGFDVTEDQLNKAFLGLKNIFGTILVFVHFMGLSVGTWHATMKERPKGPEPKGVPWAWQEMDDVKHFAVQTLDTNPLVSELANKVGLYFLKNQDSDIVQGLQRPDVKPVYEYELKRRLLP